MAPARHVIVAGAGIGGLTAAIALARAGMRITVLEQAQKLEETGAGLQLSPNASRVLIALGLRERLEAAVVAPKAIRVVAGGSGREVVRIPLGDDMERRYGAPYWSVHRGDLQLALAEMAQKELDVKIHLAVHVGDFAAHVKGVSVLGKRGTQVLDERGIALIGADGIWSSIAGRLREQQPPTFRRRTACAHLFQRMRRLRNFPNRSCISGSAVKLISCITRSRPAASLISSPSCTMSGINRDGRLPEIPPKFCAISRAGPGRRKRAR